MFLTNIVQYYHFHPLEMIKPNHKASCLAIIPVIKEFTGGAGRAHHEKSNISKVKITHSRSRDVCSRPPSPSCRSPESPGPQSPGPPCRRTDTPPRCAAPRCRDAPSPLTTGRGIRPHTSLRRRDRTPSAERLRITPPLLVSRVFTLGDGVVLDLFLFLLRLCRKPMTGPEKRRTAE